MIIKILVATHKKYCMPSDSIYFPIHVGKALSHEDLPFAADNSGENISSKNKNFCELTALYWAWKNLDADYIGLSHYRRHFTVTKATKFSKNKFACALNSTQAERYLKQCNLILPKKRNYFIESTYSQFIHAHPEESLILTNDILKELYPSYNSAFWQVMESTKGHRFNMFIMKKELFHDYCSWLFSILFELEKRLDISSYDAYNQRIFGFISERLLDVYITANRIPYTELPVIFMERENWLKKGTSFLKRKFLHKK